jgi:hypothetical protein
MKTKVTYSVLESLNNSVLSLPFSNRDKELSRQVKIKLMKLRIELDEALEPLRRFARECQKNMDTGQEKEFEEYVSIMNEKSKEETLLPGIVFTNEEFEEMIDVCSSGHAMINDNSVSRADILQLIHKYFVR